MRTLSIVASVVLALAAWAATPAQPANALIHEIIGAACRAGGEEVVPPGQANAELHSFVRALQASGVISSITTVGNDTTIAFDLDRPNSKYTAGPPLTIPDAFGPGADLTLSPLPLLDPTFAAHANCNNLNP